MAPVIDRTRLQAAVQMAQLLYDEAVEGALDGQYILGAKASLQSALTAAQGALGNSAADQAQLDQAALYLNQAVAAFLSKRITAGMGDVTGAGTEPDGRISIADLGFVAFHFGATHANPDWPAAQRADIDGNGVIDIYDLSFVAKRIN